VCRLDQESRYIGPILHYGPPSLIMQTMRKVYNEGCMTLRHTWYIFTPAKTTKMHSLRNSSLFLPAAAELLLHVPGLSVVPDFLALWAGLRHRNYRKDYHVGNTGCLSSAPARWDGTVLDSRCLNVRNVHRWNTSKMHSTRPVVGHYFVLPHPLLLLLRLLPPSGPDCPSCLNPLCRSDDGRLPPHRKPLSVSLAVQECPRLNIAVLRLTRWLMVSGRRLPLRLVPILGIHRYGQPSGHRRLLRQPRRVELDHHWDYIGRLPFLSFAPRLRRGVCYVAAREGYRE
jgi:hypothetical protein